MFLAGQHSSLGLAVGLQATLLAGLGVAATGREPLYLVYESLNGMLGLAVDL